MVNKIGLLFFLIPFLSFSQIKPKIVYTDYISFQHVNSLTAKQIYDDIVETLIVNWSKQLSFEIQSNNIKFNIFSLVNSYESFL